MQAHPYPKRSLKKCNDYDCFEYLCEGSFGKVYKAYKGDDKEKVYALKFIPKKLLKEDVMKKAFNNEVKIMKAFNHPNLMGCHENIETDKEQCIVCDYYVDGDMEQYMKKRKVECFKESEALFYLKQICCGFMTLARRNVMHRDFKILNLFVDNGRVAIGDFGFSTIDGMIGKQWLGTPEYMAPELIRADNEETLRYDAKVDMYSLGVTFYVMLFNKLPFDPKSLKKDKQTEVEQKLHNLMTQMKGQFIMHYHINQISKPCVQLLKAMITMEPESRINFEQLYNHKIMSDEHKAEVDGQIPDGKKIIPQDQIDKGHEDFMKHREEYMKWLKE